MPDTRTDLCREVASTRATSIATTLTGRDVLDANGLEWVQSATRALIGVVAHIDDDAAAIEVGEIGQAVATLAQAPNRAASSAQIAERLLLLAARLAPRVSIVAAVPLGELAILARSVAERAATTHGVGVLIDIPPYPEVDLPRPLAAMLVDVLGQVVRGAVQYGIPTGGALRINFETPPDAVVVIISDRADRLGSDQAARAGERAAMLRSAEARVVAFGGELTSGGGPWGGTSVTIRLPLLRNASRKNWTRQW